MGIAVWLDLESLLLLPLDPVDRATFARELLHRISGTGEERGQDQLRQMLELRLIEDELDRCCRLSEEGGWLEALQRLEALLPQLMQPPMADVAQALLLDLVMGVHQAMVVEESAGLPQEQRAELLWQVHRWLRRGDGIELPSHDWLQPVREQICRTAALAWLDRIEATPETGDGALARQRSLMLLIDLVPFWSPCPDWIGHYLLKGLRGACDPDNRPFHPPADRVDWALALARLPSETAQRERLEGLLGPALAALEVGRALRLPAFRVSSACP
jgi:hypothetical protein